MRQFVCLKGLLVEVLVERLGSAHEPRPNTLCLKRVKTLVPSHFLLLEVESPLKLSFKVSHHVFGSS